MLTKLFLRALIILCILLILSTNRLFLRNENTFSLTSRALFRLPAASSFVPVPNDNHRDSYPRE